MMVVLTVCATGFAQDSVPQAPTGYQMDEMVVTADRTRESLRNVSQNITVFTEQDIEMSGAASITDMLKKAGIQVYSDGAEGYGNEGVVIRGGRSSMHGFDIAGDILVLVDGHRTGSDFLGNIGLGNTARIEVIRGPGAVQYGAAAMGGVINVITKKGGKTPTATLTAGVGSWNEQRYSAGVSGQQGQMDVAMSASYYSRDDYDLGNGQTYENSDVKDRIRYNLNMGWNVNDNNRLGVIVQGSDTNDAGKGEDGSSRYNYYTRQGRDNHTLDLSWEGKNEPGSTTWLARYFQGQVNYDLERFTRSSSTQLPLSTNDNDFQGSQVQASHDFGLFHTVAGVDWISYEFDQRQEGEAASTATQNAAQSDFDNIGAFLMGEVRLLGNENLTLSAGIRYDDFDISVDARKTSSNLSTSRTVAKESWTPSLGIAYSPMEKIKLRANYARAFKMPLPRQLTGYTIMMSTPFVGNPDLEPEKSDNFDLGFDLDWNGLFASVTWFYSDYKDMIGYETHANADAHYADKHYWYYNVDSAEIQGLELGLTVDAARFLGWAFHLEPYVYWTHLLVFEDHNGWNLPDRSRDSLSAGVVFEYEKIGLTASLDTTYYGTQYTVERASGTSTTISQEKLTDVGDAWIVDFNCSQRVFRYKNSGYLKVEAGVHNLFDKKYSSNDGSWMPGQSFYLGLKYHY